MHHCATMQETSSRSVGRPAGAGVRETCRKALASVLLLLSSMSDAFLKAISACLAAVTGARRTGAARRPPPQQAAGGPPLAAAEEPVANGVSAAEDAIKAALEQATPPQPDAAAEPLTPTAGTVGELPPLPPTQAPPAGLLNRVPSDHHRAMQRPSVFTPAMVRRRERRRVGGCYWPAETFGMPALPALPWLDTRSSSPTTPRTAAAAGEPPSSSIARHAGPNKPRRRAGAGQPGWWGRRAARCSTRQAGRHGAAPAAGRPAAQALKRAQARLLVAPRAACRSWAGQEARLPLLFCSD